jgi:hypothetical protein
MKQRCWLGLASSTQAYESGRTSLILQFGRDRSYRGVINKTPNGNVSVRAGFRTFTLPALRWLLGIDQCRVRW